MKHTQSSVRTLPLTSLQTSRSSSLSDSSEWRRGNSLLPHCALCPASRVLWLPSAASWKRSRVYFNILRSPHSSHVITLIFRSDGRPSFYQPQNYKMLTRGTAGLTCKLTKLQLKASRCEGPKMQTAGQTKHVHAYSKENCIDKGWGHLNHQDLYSIIKNKILLTYHNAETILRLFLVFFGNKLLRSKAIFAIKAHQEWAVKIAICTKHHVQLKWQTL